MKKTATVAATLIAAVIFTCSVSVANDNQSEDLLRGAAITPDGSEIMYARAENRQEAGDYLLWDVDHSEIPNRYDNYV